MMRRRAGVLESAVSPERDLDGGVSQLGGGGGLCWNRPLALRGI